LLIAKDCFRAKGKEKTLHLCREMQRDSTTLYAKTWSVRTMSTGAQVLHQLVYRANEERTDFTVAQVPLAHLCTFKGCSIVKL